MLVWLLQLLEYLVPFTVVLSVLVFFHELGHYLVARYNHVRVEVFSIGFGPEVFGWNDRVGTRWKISWLPLGGYVKMWGDETAASTPDHKALEEMTKEERSASLHSKTVGQRMAVSAAGPLANYLLAFCLFTALFATVGYHHPDPAPVIGGVVSGSAAAHAGLKAEDRILEIDGNAMTQFKDVVEYVRVHAGVPVTLRIQRGDESLELVATPEAVSSETSGGSTEGSAKQNTTGRLGIYGREAAAERQGILQASLLAGREILELSWQTFAGIGRMVLGKQSIDGMGGPLMIAQLSGEIARGGIAALIWFMAVLSVNLGLINLFPVPLLDGGHLFLYGIEAVRGRPLSEKTLEWCYRLGMGVVLTLLLVTTWNDLGRLKVFQVLGALVGYNY